MDRDYLTRALRWACVPVVPVVGLLVAAGAGMLSMVLFGVPLGPLSVTSLLVCVLAPLLFVVPATLMAPSHRVAVAVGLGVIIATLGLWLVVSGTPIGALVVVAGVGASALVVGQARQGEDLASWTILRPFLGSCRRPALIAFLLVVVLSLSGLAFAPRGHGDMQITKAKADLWAIEEALEIYRGKYGTYPPDEEGLQALVRDDDGLLTRMPIDPWGRSYVYERVGEGFRIVSHGAWALRVQLRRRPAHVGH